MMPNLVTSAAIAALVAFALTSASLAQEPAQPSQVVGEEPLPGGLAVTQPLTTSDLLIHLGLLGWGFDYTAEDPFERVTLAVVALERPHLDAPFTRVPVGGALTVERPEESDRAELAVVLDTRGDERNLTLRVGDDASWGKVDLPPLLAATSGVTRRPFATGIVLPTDEQGRFILMEAYPNTENGFISTGDTADMLAYLALEVSVD